MNNICLKRGSAVISFRAQYYHPLVCTRYLQALERHNLEVIQLARLYSAEVRMTAVFGKLAFCKAPRCSHLCLLQVASTLVEQALQLQPLHLVRRLHQAQDLDLELQVSVKLSWPPVVLLCIMSAEQRLTNPQLSRHAVCSSRCSTIICFWSLPVSCWQCLWTASSSKPSCCCPCFWTDGNPAISTCIWHT